MRAVAAGRRSDDEAEAGRRDLIEVLASESAQVDGDQELFGFLTTEANAIVAPIYPSAMPVILTSPAEVDCWLGADASEDLALQRPLPDDVLRVVAIGEKADGALA